MAIATGDTITWSDIAAVMTNINTARSHCGKGTTSISGGAGTHARSQNIQDLYNALYACNGVVLPADGGTVFVKSISIPAVGSLIRPVPITDIDAEARRIAALNWSGFCTGNFGFSFGNSSFNSSNFGFSFGNSGFNSSNHGFSFGNSSFNSSNHGFRFGNSSFNSSNHGFRFGHSSFNSSNHGFRFGHSSFNSSNHGFRFSCSCQSFRFTCNSSCTFSRGSSNKAFSFRFSFLNTKSDNYIRQERIRREVINDIPKQWIWSFS